jgi:hypothetical protein
MAMGGKGGSSGATGAGSMGRSTGGAMRAGITDPGICVVQALAKTARAAIKGGVTFLPANEIGPSVTSVLI